MDHGIRVRSSGEKGKSDPIVCDLFFFLLLLLLLCCCRSCRENHNLEFQETTNLFLLLSPSNRCHKENILKLPIGSRELTSNGSPIPFRSFAGPKQRDPSPRHDTRRPSRGATACTHPLSHLFRLRLEKKKDPPPPLRPIPLRQASIGSVPRSSPISINSTFFSPVSTLGRHRDRMKLSWLAAAVLGAATTHAVEQITAVGNKFFTSSGKQFFAKGIAYQLVEGELF